MNVCFFDIDGTLIDTGGAGKSAMIAAVGEQFNVTEIQGKISVAGRSDRGIGRDLLTQHGLADSTDNWEQFRTSYLNRLRDNLGRCQGRVLPGVRPLLDLLHDRNDVHLGLLTGNVQQAALLKLTHYELVGYFFQFGGYGDDHANRDDIARAALASASAHLKNSEPSIDQRFINLWVIGDTPHDVQCARAIGANVVAVCTGLFSREQLATSQPDLLLDDLTSAGEFVDRLSNSSAVDVP